ncbi:TPA: vacuolar protein sorting 13 homolog D [Bos taurus]|nr:TPA: vacuolar protein sorting 13 homolog D [Bos taurus]
MLEGLVAWVLNTYLGKYVNNLNTDQLSVALLKGAVELENLPLKKDALKELELPFEVKAGLIGKVTLQIPFYRPHVDPWVISISSLHLIGAPEKIQDFNDEKEKLLERERKKALLQALEEKWKNERQQKGESYWYSVTASVVTRIVENIELKIQDVHLRFEDGVTNPSHPFAFGICIKNVSMQNAMNEPVQKLMRKKQLDVAEFSIYWDVDCTLLGDLPQVELQEAMDRSMESRDHHYILEPVCASALLKRNCSKEPLRSRHTPRIECDIHLETIPLKLSQLQYRQIMEFLKELERKERQVKFRKWKPKVAVSENCREWWYFALNANLHEIREQRKRCTWGFLLGRARDAVSYTDKYFTTLRGGLLSADDKEEMYRIEEEQSFEELKILRELVHERFHKQEELAESLREPQLDPLGDSPGDPGPGGGSGMLQYLQSWFPGWGGWYGQQSPEGKPVEGLMAEPQEQWTPEEILGSEEFFDPTADASCMNTYTKRDHVFAKLNLQLQRGTVTLLHQEQGAPQMNQSAFMQLEFSGVKLLAESLPRRNSSLLLVRLGGLFLRDLATEGTMFPLLVFPNPQKEVGRVSQSFGLQTTSADRSHHYPAADPDDPVFEMLYERNPVHSHFERRLNVSTRPLNIIYNPQAIKKVADFFYKGKVHTSGFGYQSELELRVAEAARRQYNRLKMQTKAEIRQTLDRLLVGDFIEESKRWTVRLDISAPQVIFPDDFKFKNPVLVVVDLGRMLLTNTQDDSKRKSGDGSALEENQFSDDEYKTPLATPPNTPPPETSSSNGEKTPPFSGVKFSEEQLQAHLMSTKMYERYSLSFLDLQIMVGRVKDNWKHVQDIDVGPTHVVEKFNVHLQLERRLIYTSDPKYPGAVLSGNLPDLKIHINEDKISALKNCFALLTTPEMKTFDSQMKEKIFPQGGQRGSLQDSVMNLTQSIVMLEQHTREVLVESQLLLAEFKVNCMQLGVESNGRYISVLKVFGTNAHFVKRPYDAEVSLTVHGLLLVDTMQTYGADFDLLMASHKNLSFDIPTGSLRDSRAQSPVSGSNVAHFTSAATRNNQSATSISLDRVLTKEQESLIKLEYQFVSSECPSMNLDSTLQVISLQVNNLDIILNPETIVELIGFLQKSFPKEKDELSPQPLMTDFERSFREQGTYQSTYEQNTEVAVEIHRLNLLLLRTVGMANGEKYGRKIATASIGGTKVNVSMGNTFDMNGSLGCLQLMDLTQENVKNQYVVSIGNSVGYENIISDIGFYESVFVRMEDAALTDALSFTFVEKSKQECFLNLKMASLHYNHSAKFLKELTLSMDELEENFRSMLKSAATKVTTVLATKTAEYSEMVSLFETPRKARDSFFLEENEPYGFGLGASHSDTVKLILNINIESPVVSIPRKPGSPELLVGHLGQIFIQNFVAGDDESRSDRLQVEIKDIKLYSLNCTQLTGREGPGPEMSRAFCPLSGSANANSQEEAHFTRHDFFESLHRGQAFHILNNTTIQFKLEKIPIERESELTFSLSPDDLGASSIMKIEGKFVNPVQVVLAKHVYEQVLQTLDNLVYSEDLNKFPVSAASSPCPNSPLPPLSTCGEPSAERKENGLFSHSSLSNSSQKSLSVKEVKSFTQIQANFCISELQVQLSGDLTLGAQGLVSLKFQDFEVEFSKDHPQTLSIQIALRSLLMEDLLEKNPDSKYKNLMVSRGAPKPSSLAQKEYLSQSCPSVSNVEYPDMPRSLPSHMEEAPNVFQLYQRPTSASRKKQKEVQDKDYPLTPPPSPTVDEPKILAGKSKFDDSLVHINVFLVDKKHPEFSSSYNRVNRSIDVDFNCLDVLITLQTWVVILDFFGIGSTADNHAMKVPPEDVLQNVKSESSALAESELQEPVNTKLDLKVHSLSLVLNKTTSELAKANVSKLVAHLEMIEGDLALQGSIGSLSLSDLTSHGEFYRERFTTSGEEALIFQTFKYGRPDPLLRREHDVRVSLQMASVQYVHTQRFQAEVVAFIQHFTQLQDVLGRQRAAIEGQTVRDQAQRYSRVLLDIEAGAPVLLIPESSRSNNLIVANLGKLKVKNKFLFAGFPGTFTLQDKESVPSSSPTGTPKRSVRKMTSMEDLKGTHSEGLIMMPPAGMSRGSLKSESVPSTSTKQQGQPATTSVGRASSSPEDHVCLLDCIVVDLQDMDIFAAERHPREYSRVSEDSSGDLIFPSYFVRQTGGSLLTEPCRLKLQVERNLDKEISHTVPDISIHGNLSSVHCSLDLCKYKLIRGLLENNLGEPIEEFMRPYDLQDPRIHTVLSGEVYTCMCFLIDMVNVSLELKDPKGKEAAGSLARFDFKKCKLLYESFSNQTKSVNLVSHSMMAFDTRSAGQKTSPGVTNVFTCIFQPSKSSSTTQGSIQIELHFRSTKDSSCFTVVLNNLRVFLIFDWLLLVHDFLHTPSDIKKPAKVTPFRHRNSSSESAVIPKTVKSGVVTKRSSLPVSTERHLEVKVNVTGTEFVVVEDVSCFDTNAIILKGTTVLTYKPRFVDRPFSGSLFGIEVFSCRLGNEHDTALSIVDPVQIHVELVGNSSYQNSSGLMDAFNSEDFPPILEIQLQALDIRLSYNDVQLFLAIAKSIPEQANAAVPDVAALEASSVHSYLPGASRGGEEVREGTRHTLDPVLELQLARLQELGFSTDDCRKALLVCQGNLNKAFSLHTHDLRIHQLQVRVNGWEQVSPVSVDKVGTFFRYAAPDKNSSSSTIGSPSSRTNIIHPQVYFSSLPPVRVVFAVTMEGSARKVITVRSALIVKNRLETPMELRLDSPSAPDKPVVLPAIMPGDSFAVPLHLTSWRLQARPKGLGVFFCKAPIHWTNVVKTAEVSSSKRECHSMDTEKSRFFRFCVAIKKENYPDYMPSNIFSDSAKQIFRQPGHTIYLLPTVVICNLLPCELDFYVKGMPINGTLKPGKEVALHTADTSQNIELGVSLENFPLCKELLIPPGTQNYMVRMRLYDTNRRQLNLTIRIVCRAEGSLKIFISAPYWLINKTGLPLIFRQDNAKTDAAGQFEEHELARSLSPLLFCYADKEQPNLCTMRIGRGIHPEGMPGWCQGFSLDGGSGVRALRVIQQGNRPGLIYNIGIDVKKGRGRYIDTCMVIFAPRYLLDNKSSHKLAFAQREFARGQGTANPEGYISTLPGSSVVFHWPRNDYDQLLCVRLMDVPNCIWSGGFEVNKNNSFHINMRDTLGKCFFLRVEITLRGATYRISFSDTDQLPTPFRIDNFSKVPVVFTQHGVAEPRLRTEVKPMTSLDYAWDEPTLPPFITLTVKGAGSSEISCNMNDFQDNQQLYYENFIYIAATYTFSGLQEGTGRPVTSNKAVTCAELVLDVSPKTQRVILKKKEPGKRSQLWRMTGTGMLAHEGSSVPHNPSEPSAARSAEGSAILDIAGLAAVTDNRYEPLMLRKPDRRRSTTQTWSFREGKLTCGLHGLVVQAKGGLSGLFDGAEVVLGPDTSMQLLGPVPPEQQFINQKMRPGSGMLSIRVVPDGPTRALQITDFSQRKSDRSSYEVDELPVTERELQKLKNPDTEQELEVLVKLEGGIGLSLINKVPEELVFASLTGINVHYTQLATSHMLELSIQDVQVDNQLIGTTQPFMLYVTPLSNENEVIETGPAVQVNAVKFPSKSTLTNIYKHLMVTAQRFTVQIEEKLLLKLLSFFGYDQAESEVEKYDENLHEKTAEQGGTPIRYYFENLKISIPQIKLSVFTSNKLPLDLKALKSTLGFPLIRFEDAVINLDPFTRVHPYETKDFIINDILKHFQEELLSQAARILGSVDFLGNPMGLLNDVSEGVTGLIKYGNVGGLIRNVTHGVSNSAAKFAGTLSDGLGKTMDNRHQSEREYIRYHAATSGEHLVAGIHGLAHGIIGGLTSVITSTVEGVKTEGGVSGFISGLGKGLVGTVTKPVAGALDFASETAQAVRDTATLSGPRTQAQRVRKPRCCTGPQGLLPRYSESQAEGQEQLFKLTDNIQDEFFIAVENIDSYCVLISSKAVYFLRSGDYVDREAIFLEVKYDDLYHCLVSKDHGKVYVQVTKKAVNTSSGVSIPGPSHQKPMVHVKSEVLAIKLSQEINYAKSLYYEQQLMLRLSENQEQLELDS